VLLRLARPDGAPIYVTMDKLSAHKGTDIRRWAEKKKVELCFTSTCASWANPIEAHFGPLRQFTIANSNHPNHTVQPRALHGYLRWRNANARNTASWPRSAKNAHASVARRASAGADAASHPQPDHPGDVWEWPI
jgi:hypothetical protein